MKIITFNAYHFMIVLTLIWEIGFKVMYDVKVDGTEIWLMLILFALVDILKTLNRKQ